MTKPTARTCIQHSAFRFPAQGSGMTADQKQGFKDRNAAVKKDWDEYLEVHPALARKVRRRDGKETSVELPPDMATRVGIGAKPPGLIFRAQTRPLSLTSLWLKVIG